MSGAFSTWVAAHDVGTRLFPDTRGPSHNCHRIVAVRSVAVDALAFAHDSTGTTKWT